MKSYTPGHFSASSMEPKSKYKLQLYLNTVIYCKDLFIQIYAKKYER